MKYNVLLITSDQQHYNTLGKFNPEIRTPNLDRLCQEGACFTRAYTVNPTCTPTRASLITGKYPSQHGAWTLGTKLREDMPTLGGILQRQGVRTGLVGKAHFQPLRDTPEYPSLESEPGMQDLAFWQRFDRDFYGFDTVRLARNHTNESHVGQHYALWMERKGLRNWRDYFAPPTGTMDKNARHAWRIPEEYHYNTWIAEEANALLDAYKQGEQPFFLWASFFDPHPPYLVPEEYVDLYDPDCLTLPKLSPGEHDDSPAFHRLTQQENPDFSPYAVSGYFLHGMHSHRLGEAEARRNMATYYAMVTLMDKYIGKIVDHLDALGLAENTIVLFSTDHGHFFGQHGLHAKGPFLYEDMIKVPFIVRCPGTVPAGVVSEALQSLVDVPVTALDYAGAPIPYDMTGVNQRQVWEGRAESARRHIICEHHHERSTVNVRAYVNERYKLVVYQDRAEGELYDLKADPQELHNAWLDPAYGQIKQELLMRYIWAELEKESLYMPRVCEA